MDCFAPTLGHTSIRCAELSSAHARLLMLPASVYLIGALLMLANWARLVLARREIRQAHFAILTLYGLLTFGLAAADLDHAVDEAPYASSRIIGVLSIALTALLIVTIFTFSPPRAAVQGWLERTMVATSSCALICTLLASIVAYTPDGLDAETRNDVYAACAFMLTFLLASLAASQSDTSSATEPRGVIHAFVTLQSTSSVLFVFALLALIAQTGIAFVVPTHFVSILTASLFGALAYTLFVAASIVVHLEPTTIPRNTLRDSVPSFVQFDPDVPITVSRVSRIATPHPRSPHPHSPHPRSTIVHMPSIEAGPSSLAERYNSGKLFPSPTLPSAVAHVGVAV